MQTFSQIEIDFTPATTNHPGNIERLRGQNKRLYDWLIAGNSIHFLSQAKTDLRIGFLNSRISDLRNKCGLQIYDKMIKVGDIHCNLYSMQPFPAEK